MMDGMAKGYEVRCHSSVVASFVLKLTTDPGRSQIWKFSLRSTSIVRKQQLWNLKKSFVIRKKLRSNAIGHDLSISVVSAASWGPLKSGASSLDSLLHPSSSFPLFLFPSLLFNPTPFHSSQAVNAALSKCAPHPSPERIFHPLGPQMSELVPFSASKTSSSSFPLSKAPV